jgi:uncharacterized membrane protein YgcG
MIDIVMLVSAVAAVAVIIVYFWARSARLAAEEEARRELALREIRQRHLDALDRIRTSTKASAKTTLSSTSTVNSSAPATRTIVADTTSDDLATAMLINNMMINSVQPVVVESSPSTYIYQEAPSMPDPEPVSASYTSVSSGYSSNDSYSSSSSWSSSDSSSSYSSDSGSSFSSSD